MDFKPGDVIRKQDGSSFYCARGKTAVVIAPPAGLIYSAKGKVFFEDKVNGGFVWIGKDFVEKVPMYEDGWILNDGLVQIPPDAKTLKDEEGDVVAFKRVKKPVVKEYVRWAGKAGDEYRTTTTKNNYYKNKLIFTEVDGVLDSVRLEKD